MVTKVLFLTFMSMCMGIGICMGTEPPSEPFQGTFEQSKRSIAPVRLILHGRGTFEFYGEESLVTCRTKVSGSVSGMMRFE